jgi:hypothetical protein
MRLGLTIARKNYVKVVAEGGNWEVLKQAPEGKQTWGWSSPVFSYTDEPRFKPGWIVSLGREAESTLNVWRLIQ